MLSLVTPGDTPVLFAHNETFALEPSADSNAAWEDVIPGRSQTTSQYANVAFFADGSSDGMGFIQHEALGPEIAGLSFVHQLHCVQRIRAGYCESNYCH